MKKKFVLSEQALKVLKKPEVKLKLMVFFGVNDARTLESYLKNNSPDGPLMNYNIRGLIQEYAPFLSDAGIYRKLSMEERDEMNKTKQDIKRELKEYTDNEQSGESD